MRYLLVKLHKPCSCFSMVNPCVWSQEGSVYPQVLSLVLGGDFERLDSTLGELDKHCPFPTKWFAAWYLSTDFWPNCQKPTPQQWVKVSISICWLNPHTTSLCSSGAVCQGTPELASSPLALCAFQRWKSVQLKWIQWLKNSAKQKNTKRNEDNAVEPHEPPHGGEPPGWSGQVQNNNNNACIRVWRSTGERYQACNIVHNDISLEGSMDLQVRNRGNLTGARCRDEILSPIVRPCASAVGPRSPLVRGNARPHVARVCHRFLEDEDIHNWLASMFSGPELHRAPLGHHG